MDNPTFTVEEPSVRLADFLRKRLSISSDHLKRLLAREWIIVNQEVRTRKSSWLERGDIVQVGASTFQIDQLRFRDPPLRVVYDGNGEDGGGCRIAFKPGGVALDGGDPVTVEKALPAIMDDERYSVVDSVGRIASGPVIVSLNDGARRRLREVHKRYTFRLIVHGDPPDGLAIDGFVSLEKLQTVESTSGDLSVIEVILQHSGDGLRGCLKRIDCPILGTSASIKSAARGCFFACTKLELLWKDDAPTVVEMEVPEKFHTVVERERKFYDARKKGEAEEEQKRQRLRREYAHSMAGDTGHLLSSNDWSVASFCGLSFYVTEHVMIPRPSSKLLVQAAREYMPKAESRDVSVLDLGTGSGCLLVSTLVHASHVKGVGIDISEDALKIAEINVRTHGLSDRAALLQGDFNDLSFLSNQTFDVILCNPPYLTEGECDKDRLTCPRVALVAKNRGLACYEAVARQVDRYLRPNGLMIMEVGGKRKVEDVRAIFRGLDHVETQLDDQGQGRCLVLRKSMSG